MAEGVNHPPGRCRTIAIEVAIIVCIEKRRRQRVKIEALPGLHIKLISFDAGTGIQMAGDRHARRQ